MNTETTETIRGWLCYDAACPVCRGWVARCHTLLVRRGCHAVPLQAALVQARLGLKAGERLVEMKWLTADGAVFGGADALLQMARIIWWAWPLHALAQLPGVKPLLRVVYRLFAANRYCLGGKCVLPGRQAVEHKHRATTFLELP